jgi:ADP-ribosylglycohydrolase
MRKLTDAILGFAVGDALGVPYEFTPREQCACSDMVGYGTYNQPPGTWRDDISMTLATISSLNTSALVPNLMFTMIQFEEWYSRRKFTPYGEVFDVGNTTRNAIEKFKKTYSVKNCAGKKESDNGNGALMRMLPIAFLPYPIKGKLRTAREFAALTHAHERNILACELYVEIADNLIRGVDDWLMSAYSLIQHRGDPDGVFDRIPNIKRLSRSEIRSSGYVIDTLEAALWCVLTTDNYRDCALSTG